MPEESRPYRHEEAGWNSNLIGDLSPHSVPTGLNADLLNFRVPGSIQSTLAERNITVQFVETGWGPVNLDYYPVHVTEMPVVAGRKLTAPELLQHFRTDLPNFVNQGVTTVGPASQQDAALWNSASPHGAIMSFKGLVHGVNMDDCAVVTAHSGSDKWVFSTLDTPLSQNGGHVVSGNREFGYREQPDGSHIFYIRGVDRLATLPDFMGDKTLAGAGNTSYFFSAAHQNWSTVQTMWTTFINVNGGSAESITGLTGQLDWDLVQEEHFHPEDTIGVVSGAEAGADAQPLPGSEFTPASAYYPAEDGAEQYHRPGDGDSDLPGMEFGSVAEREPAVPAGEAQSDQLPGMEFGMSSQFDGSVAANYSTPEGYAHVDPPPAPDPSGAGTGAQGNSGQSGDHGAAAAAGAGGP